MTSARPSPAAMVVMRVMSWGIWCQSLITDIPTIVRLSAVGTEGMAELRLCALRDVTLQLAPLAALVANTFAEAANREHTLQQVKLAPLPSEETDHLGEREENHDVYRGVGELQRPGTGHVPDVIEEGQPHERQGNGECRAPASPVTPGGYSHRKNRENCHLNVRAGQKVEPENDK